MKKTKISVCLVAVVCLLIGNPHRVLAQQPPNAQPVENQSSSPHDFPGEEAPPAGEVVIDGTPILRVYESIANLSPEGRAQGIETRIIALARDSATPAESVRLQAREAWTEILGGNTVIMAVTDADARAAGMNRDSLALQDAENIRQAVRTYRQEHSWRMLLRAILKTVLVTLVMVGLLWLVRQL